MLKICFVIERKGGERLENLVGNIDDFTIFFCLQFLTPIKKREVKNEALRQITLITLISPLAFKVVAEL